MKNIFKAILLLSFIYINKIDAQPSFPQNPNEAVLVSTDLKNFIDAFNSLSEKSDTVLVLQSLYIDKASVGLKEYIAKFELTADAISKAMQKHIEDYKKIEHFYNNLQGFEKEFKREMKFYKQALPNAMFPPSYLLVADHKGIGQASKYGQLISIEKKCVDDYEVLKNLMIHELTHFQQAKSMGMAKYVGVYQKKENMLDIILREGGAEFITYKLVRNKAEQFKRLKYYEENEKTLWKRFLADIKTQDKNYWITVPEESNGDPGMAGYSIGYKIIEAYYNQAKNKDKALEDILKLEDPVLMFKISNYKPNN